MTKLPGKDEETGKVDTLQGITKKELAELVHGLRKRIRQLEDSLESMTKAKRDIQAELNTLKAKMSGKIGVGGVKNPLVR